MTEENANPSVIIVSSSNTKPRSIIKLITKNGKITEFGEHRVSSPWQINTKYYTAKVDLHGITELFERDEPFNQSVQALVVHMDSNKESGLEDLKMWEQIENDSDPEIKLLLANYCTNETKVTKADATNWCLSKGYEFIELYPTSPPEISEEDTEIIPEKFGVERVIEALQAHVWPNLEMNKNEKTQANSGAASSIVNDLNALFGDENCLDDFTEIFSQLKSMKESIQSLPEKDRKRQAEEFVTTFWKAIGGDDDELDLSD